MPQNRLASGYEVTRAGLRLGVFEKYAAEKYSAEVHGVTVSREQVELGRALCQGLPVELRLQDKRDIKGQHHAVISIGIMEHFSCRNYRTYMEVVHRTLKPGGIALIPTIGTT